MKILFFISQMGGGGAERVMANLVNELVDRNYDVVLAFDTSIKSVYDIDHRVKIMNRFADDYPIVSSGLCNKIYRRVWEIKQYRKIAQQVKPDVVVSFMTRCNYYIITSMLGTGIPVICSEHTNLLRPLPNHWHLKRRLIYPFANCVTVLTHHDYKIAKSKFSWRVVRMPNPVPAVKRDESVSRRKVIFSAGTVSSWNIKGFDLLLKAWDLVANDFPEWRIEIAGKYDDASISVLNDIIEENHIPRVEFLGFRQDVNELMSKAEVYCLSSRVEGLPMSLIESMQAGCCCVAFDCLTGPSEIIQDGVSGLLANAEDFNSLAEKLKVVLNDSKLRRELAHNAPKAVDEYLSYNVASRWERLFKQILKKKTFLGCK